jgi:hypothetical protein
MSEASPKGKSMDGRNTKSPGAILHETVITQSVITASPKGSAMDGAN